MAKRVKFGARSVEYAKITDYDAVTKLPTYAALKTVNCPTEFSSEAVGEISKFYCGDAASETFTSSDGYTGTLTGTMLEDDFLVDVLNFELDATSGGMFEYADDQPNDFAFVFSQRFKENGVEKGVKYVFYKTTCTRQGAGGSTTTETIEAGTDELALTMTPLDIQPKRLVVGKFVEGSAGYTQLEAGTIPFPSSVAVVVI